MVVGGGRKRKEEKEIAEDDKVNVGQHRWTISNIIAKPISEVCLELSKHLNLLEEKTGEAPEMSGK